MPTDSVRIVIFNQNSSSYLILTEHDDPENWKLPGGKFNSASESPESAANRELAEELGVNEKDVGLVKVAELVNEDGVSARYIFSGRVAGSHKIKPTAEVFKYNWVTIKTVPEGKNQGHIISAAEAALTNKK